MSVRERDGTQEGLRDGERRAGKAGRKEGKKEGKKAGRARKCRRATRESVVLSRNVELSLLARDTAVRVLYGCVDIAAGPNL